MLTRFQKHDAISFRSFRRLNEFKLMNDLIIMPWFVLDAFDDFDDVMHNFGKILLAIWAKHACIKQRLMQAAPLPWITGDTASMVRSRDAAFRNYLCVKTDALWISHKQIRNKCIAAIKIAKRSFFIYCARSDLLALWCQVKSSTGLG